jgi:plasmid maintenance system antidote protein VapI
MQRQFNFIGLLKAPSNAPDSIVSRIENAAQAVRVAIVQKGLKLAYYAAEMHVSESYISRIANGQRTVPEWFVEPFCSLSGSNLLRQYLTLQQALHIAHNDLTRSQKDRQLADQLRAAA